MFFLKNEELVRDTVRKTEIEDFQILTLSNYNQLLGTLTEMGKSKGKLIL